MALQKLKPLDGIYLLECSRYVLVMWFITVIAIDWLQTRYILRSDDFYEINPVIRWVGKDLTWLYFLLAATVVICVAVFLPLMWGVIWLCVVSIVQTACVIRNYKIGVKLEL